MKEFGLSKSERIKKKREFELVFSSGKKIYCNSNKIKAVYYVVKKPGVTGLKVGFAVHGKSGTAVWRNRIKRLLRQAFRLNKQTVLTHCLKTGILLFLVFSTHSLNKKKSNRVSYDSIERDVVELMEKIKSVI